MRSPAYSGRPAVGRQSQPMVAADGDDVGDLDGHQGRRTRFNVDRDGPGAQRTKTAGAALCGALLHAHRTSTSTWRSCCRWGKSRALRQLEALWGEGRLRAAAFIGWLYAYGRQIERDPNEAEHWHLRAAEAGDKIPVP